MILIGLDRRRPDGGWAPNGTPEEFDSDPDAFTTLTRDKSRRFCHFSYVMMLTGDAPDRIRHTSELLSRDEPWVYYLAPATPPGEWFTDPAVVSAIPQVVVDATRRGAYVLFDQSFEGFKFPYWFWPKFVDELTRRGIDPNRAIILTGNHRAYDTYVAFSRAYGHAVHLHAWDYFEHASAERYVRELDLFPTMEEARAAERTRILLCLNRRRRHHRTALMLHMQRRGFLDGRHAVSFPDEASLKDGLWEGVDKTFPRNHPEFVALSTHSDGLRSALPLIADTADFETNHAFTPNPKRLYLDTHISLVPETTFTSDLLFLSEKVYKPMMNYHPFFVAGDRGITEHLARRGYRMFADIDQAYDDIYDPADRMQAIFSLVDRFSTDPRYVREVFDGSWEDVVHNRDRLLSCARKKPSYAYKLAAVMNTKF